MIRRDPSSAGKEEFDVIVIGGGVYGIMLSLEASRRKLRSLLIERDDFGGGTSANSLRILHGGFRYLQSMDLARFRESVTERGWFIRSFPSLVKTLPCMMPLYGKGLRRRSILRIATAMNGFLSRNLDHRGNPDSVSPAGEVIDAEETGRRFPMVNGRGLEGGAVWYDAFMPDPQRVLLGCLRWACRRGGEAINYLDARALLTTAKGEVRGVTAFERETGLMHEFRAKTIINAAGPECRDLAGRFDRDNAALFRKSIAWNVLLKRNALSDHALAVFRPDHRGQTYFLVPWKGMVLAGTGHAPCDQETKDPAPPGNLLDHFLGEINLAVPGLHAGKEDILHVFSGFLPVTREGNTRLTTREVIWDHGKRGGPKGLHSVCGIKFTTARLVADKMLSSLFPEETKAAVSREETGGMLRRENERPPGTYDFSWYPEERDRGWETPLEKIVAEEAVVHLDDLVFRRTSLGDNPERARRMAPELARLFRWEEARRMREIKRVLREHQSVPGGRIQHTERGAGWKNARTE